MLSVMKTETPEKIQQRIRDLQLEIRRLTYLRRAAEIEQRKSGPRPTGQRIVAKRGAANA